jgi:cell fate regulator YaaT (PSP1 superfamily)
MEISPPAAPNEAAPRLVGIKFHDVGTVFPYDPGDLDLRWGEQVVVPTDEGQRIGTVTALPKSLRAPEVPPPKVLRRASESDLERAERVHERELEALRICLHRVRALGLPMKIVRVEQADDARKIIFYFFAEGRVDFRQLVRELAHALRSRIEMKQIGHREEAKLIGAMGPCGRELCCSTFLRTPGGVSVKMAKAQGLSLNPSKLSGMCGRLKCCLKYEYETYLELGRGLPAVGSHVVSLHGNGVVLKQNILKQTVVVGLDEGGAQVEVSLEELVEKRSENSEPKE